jgi:hypothetical protein
VTFSFELHRKKKESQTYDNVTCKLQIETEKKLGNAKVMVVIVILVKPQYGAVYFLRHIYII